MPKTNINDALSPECRAEVSWRPEERVCRCGTIWSAPAPQCPECGQEDVPVTSGHVQVASVNLKSPFEFPEVKTEGHWQAAEPFNGWRITLDADGIDRAITALTKAKRQAYPTPEREDLLEAAWGLICNASNRTIDAGGPVDASPGWQDAATRWRDQYHEHIRHDS